MELLNGLPVLKIDVDSNDKFGVDKVSIVDVPAIEEEFLSFSQIDKIDDEIFKFDIVEEMKLAGAFLIPDKPILRRHPKTNQPFYVVFTKETIETIVERFNQNLYGNKWNEQHSEDEDLKDVFVLENWIIDEPEKDKSSSKFGMSLPSGTWFGIVKVNNEKLWKEKIKTGELRGFSVELLAGLKFSIDSQLIEEFAIEQMEGLGEIIPEGARLIHVEDVSENEDEFDLDDLQKILEFNIKADPDADSSLDVRKGDEGKWIVRYKYSGPKDSKNRDFCRKVLNYQNRTGKVFRREDINQMSFRGENSDFGVYSIFRYKGSYGCRHKWQRLIYFVDFEDDETRKVGNVPRVTSSINDSEARTKNPQPSRSNLSKTDNTMSEIKSNFEMIEELAPENRVIDAQVDNADGEYVVDGVTYVVSGGVITEIKEETPEGETPETPEGETPETPEGEDGWKMEVMNKIAELEAKVEQILSMMNGSDESSSEQFSKTELEEVLTKFMSELRPADENKKENDEKTEKKETDKVSSVIFTLNKLKEQKNK